MSDIVIKVENLSKQYRLGAIGGKTLRNDLHRWWAKWRGKPDPTLPVTHKQAAYSHQPRTKNQERRTDFNNYPLSGNNGPNAPNALNEPNGALPKSEIGFVHCPLQMYNQKQRQVRMDYRKYIIRDQKICGGQPVIAGTRVPLRTVLASLAEGVGVKEIVEDFPSLTEEQVQAVVAFAAASAEEDLPVPGLPKVA